MKRITLLAFLLSSVCLLAQNNTLTYTELKKEIDPLKASIKSLQNADGWLRNEITALNNQLATAKDSIALLSSQIEAATNAINQATNQLDTKITNTAASANQKIQEVDNSLSKKSLWGIIGLLSAILISGVIYFLLSKKQRTDKSDLIERLSQTKSSIEESLVKEFGKQTELMETQLKMMEEEKKNKPQEAIAAEVDHSLALKVADEITLIERNISLMDKGVRGLKQLSRSVQKLKDNLNANGYEIPELLGKPFHQGMKLIVVNSIPDDTLNEGDEIITKIIKPQVNYKEKMIQAAQVEVSVG